LSYLQGSATVYIRNLTADWAKVASRGRENGWRMSWQK
jgi:hypothetical protein